LSIGRTVLRATPHDFQRGERKTKKQFPLLCACGEKHTKSTEIFFGGGGGGGYTKEAPGGVNGGAIQ